MKYLDNKYTRVYKRIVDRARHRTLDGYYERHHVFPKSLGGTNDANNIVKLTAKEHFLCHRLLTKMTIGEDLRKMRFAAYMLSRVQNSHQRRYLPNGRTYELLKLEYLSERKMIPGNRRGSQMSDAQKKKISAALKGRIIGPKSEETISKLRGLKRSDETRQRISDARRGVSTGKRSDETKAKMSAWQKGIPKPKVKCEFCGLESSLLNISRWHGEKCKLSPSRC